MGAPNIEDWTPGDNSLIRTDQFSGPKQLAEHLTRLLNDQSAYEAHLQWKRGQLSQRFRQKIQRCVIYGSECRLCLKCAARDSMRTDLTVRSQIGTPQTVASGCTEC